MSDKIELDGVAYRYTANIKDTKDGMTQFIEVSNDEGYIGGKAVQRHLREKAKPAPRVINEGYCSDNRSRDHRRVYPTHFEIAEHG